MYLIVKISNLLMQFSKPDFLEGMFKRSDNKIIYSFPANSSALHVTPHPALPADLRGFLWAVLRWPAAAALCDRHMSAPDYSAAVKECLRFPPPSLCSDSS